MITYRMFIYTDGACLSNPGDGGYACVIHTEDKYIGLYGNEANTTNNRMELLGMIAGLEYVQRLNASDVCLVSDSQYVVKGINEWMAGWVKNGWKNSAKEPVKNGDLWQRVYRLHNLLRNQVTIQWQAAHTLTNTKQFQILFASKNRSNNHIIGNHLADMLASCSARLHVECECSLYFKDITQL